MLGVFIDFVIPESPSSLGYASSVRIENIRTLEGEVRKLRSPRWPEAFPLIDAAKRDKGRAACTKNIASGATRPLSAMTPTARS